MSARDPTGANAGASQLLAKAGAFVGRRTPKGVACVSNSGTSILHVEQSVRLLVFSGAPLGVSMMSSRPNASIMVTVLTVICSFDEPANTHYFKNHDSRSGC